MNQYKVSIFVFLLVTGVLYSCNYLDVVPEGTSRLENAFSMREPTQRYLYTCYSYITHTDQGGSFELIGGDELWTMSKPDVTNGVFTPTAMGMAEGRQSATSVVYDRWGHFYTAIRDCNTFLEGMNIYEIPDLENYEREQWIAEVKALKAWYYFSLLQQYGPVPLIKENLPVSASVDEVKITRNTVDEVVNYIVELIDEAVPVLPAAVRIEGSELGRMTLPIALSIKAQVLIYAASPLFNCNTELANLKNHDGTQLFPQDESEKIVKWERAKEACLKALYVCMDSLGMKLYTFPGDPKYSLSDVMMQQMSLRNAICDRWNEEVIWGNTRQWMSGIQIITLPHLDPRFQENSSMKTVLGVPLKIAEMFYSDNGVPIDEDKTWNYNTRYQLQTATSTENRYIHEGSVTVRMHFNREPRFYAWMAFDQGVWYGQGVFDDSNPSNLYYWKTRGVPAFSTTNTWGYGVTGYIPKKYIHYKSVEETSTLLRIEPYIWPTMRLSELLLYCAEAINEADDTQTARDIAMEYIDMVRERAGLESIAESWAKHSNNPNKYNSQSGLREIIQHERLIELCFEGKRFFDLRRWKTAPDIYNNSSIQGWDLQRKEPEFFYKPITIFEQRFGLKDYFFPISDDELTRNTNLVQNIGW